jgi:TatD DNase family protein
VIVDSHCHLDDSSFDGDRDTVIAAAREAGVGYIMAIGTGGGPPVLDCAIRLAERYPGVYATVGVHPHDAAKAGPATPGDLRRLAAHPKVLAVGEIGLDYHYDHSPRDVQRRVFIEQIELARNLGKPIVIHTREAWDDTISILETHWKSSGLGGIMHCFSGGADQARRALDAGFHISFAGVVTFRRAEELRAAAAMVPLGRLLVETDAPYLTPEPYRKIRRNEPRFVVETARRLAEARGIEFEAIAEAATRNFLSLFDLPLPEQGV